MKRLLILFSLIAVFLTSCTEDNTVNEYGFDKNLVIIGDDEPTNEIVLKIKGRVTSENPDVNVEYYQTKDLDIYEASYILENAAENYPENTYFAVLVEPGLESKRIVFTSGERTVFAPDNCVTTRFRKNYTPDRIYEVNNLNLFDSEYGSINEVPADEFYAATINNMLSGEISLENFGDAVDELTDLEIQVPVFTNGTAKGEILYVSNFGNCETNITESVMANFEKGDILEVSAGSERFYVKLGTDYGSVNKYENVAFITGSKKLILAVNYGEMSNRYGLSSGTKLSIKKASIKAGILQYNNSDLVQSFVAGTKASLEDLGFREGENIEYIIKNGEGNIPSLKGLVNELISDSVDVIIPVSTPASQAAVNFTPESIPVVFTYVTSPEFAGILNVRSGVTGLSDATNINDYLDFVTELMPDISKAGRIYNPDEANSEFFQDAFENNAHLYELEYQTEEVNSGNEIQSAFSNLQSYDPDAILIGADNTLNLNMEQLAQLCMDNDLPLIGDSHQNTEAGALASISVDYDELATSTGAYVSSVILGMPPAELSIKKFGNSVISLNAGTASEIGFDFSQDMLDKAAEVLD